MDILPLLSDAIQSERTWLRDFADDEITISMDLYEVSPSLPTLPPPVGLNRRAIRGEFPLY